MPIQPITKNNHRKASFSYSPLAHASTPIHRLASRIQDYLHFPDPFPLYVLTASLAANYAEGRPVWLMLIGPQSCGKSELLNSLLSLDHVHEGGSISGIGALLSGSRKKDRAKDSTGGLLREIGERGALVIKEFTSILSLPHETMRNVLSAFREVYDGRYTRSVGSDGGNDQHWEGKIAVLTGCTESIDHHHALISDMGERFIFYRYEASDGWPQAYKALSVDHGERLTNNLQSLISQFAEDTALDWTSPPELPDLDSHDKQRIIAFSQVSAHGRSAVIRDPYTKEIIQSSIGEYPIRLSLAFGQLLRALRYIGVNEDEAWRIVRKCSFDSMPGNRRQALLAIMKGARTTAAIADEMNVSQAVARRSLEELRIHTLIVRADLSAWALSKWAKERFREATNGTGIKIQVAG